MHTYAETLETSIMCALFLNPDPPRQIQPSCAWMRKKKEAFTRYSAWCHHPIKASFFHHPIRDGAGLAPFCMCSLLQAPQAATPTRAKEKLLHRWMRFLVPSSPLWFIRKGEVRT
ncbi:hypothetical protein J3F84DRAFT_192436 [Trichoderma pleuroticola]